MQVARSNLEHMRKDFGGWLLSLPGQVIQGTAMMAKAVGAKAEDAAKFAGNAAKESAKAAINAAFKAAHGALVRYPGQECYWDRVAHMQEVMKDLQAARDRIIGAPLKDASPTLGNLANFLFKFSDGVAGAAFKAIAWLFSMKKVYLIIRSLKIFFIPYHFQDPNTGLFVNSLQTNFVFIRMF